MNVRSVLVVVISLLMLAGVLCAALLLDRGVAIGSDWIGLSGMFLMVLAVAGGSIGCLVITDDDHNSSLALVAFLVGASVMLATAAGTYASWFGRPIEATAAVVAGAQVQPCAEQPTVMDSSARSASSIAISARRSVERRPCSVAHVSPMPRTLLRRLG